MEFSIKGSTAKIYERNSKSTASDNTRTFQRVVATNSGNWVPEKDFHIGVYTTSDGYQYFAFTWNKTSITWISASETGKEISSLRELKRLVAGRRSTTGSNTYSLISLSDGQRLRRADLDHEAIEKQKKKSESASTQSTQPKRAPAPPSGIDRLDPGDVVFVQGIFSDEPVQVVRIDRASGQIKVRRSSDGTTKWVHHSQLIDRDQKTMNNVGRTAVGIGLAVCLFSPETCKDN